MTLQKAVDMGEYDPNYLAKFDLWATLPRHTQFEYIKKALENRNSQLLGQWAEINNFLDFSQKPHLKKALDNLQKQLKELQEDKERLFLEYSVI